MSNLEADTKRLIAELGLNDGAQGNAAALGASPNPAPKAAKHAENKAGAVAKGKKKAAHAKPIVTGGSAVAAPAAAKGIPKRIHRAMDKKAGMTDSKLVA